MKMKIEFSMDNAAFDDYPANEIEIVLRSILLQIGDSQTLPYGKTPVRDHNGNTIGFFTFTEE